MSRGPRPAPPPSLDGIETKEATYAGEIAPGVHVFGATRPMGRIRAYSAAGLAPFPGRGAPSEFLLLGHVHLDGEGKATRVEGFNGAEGERWAKEARDKLASRGGLAADAAVTPLAPLRSCPHTGIR